MGLDKTVQGYQEEGVIKILKDIRDGLANGVIRSNNMPNRPNDDDDRPDRPDDRPNRKYYKTKKNVIDHLLNEIDNINKKYKDTIDNINKANDDYLKKNRRKK